jgi:hypothetical protein
MGLWPMEKKIEEKGYEWERPSFGDFHRRAADLTVGEFFAAFALAGMMANPSNDHMEEHDIVTCAHALGLKMSKFYEVNPNDEVPPAQ